MRRAAAACAAAVALGAGACGGAQETEGSLADRLETDTRACGLDSSVPPPQALREADTLREQVDALVPYVERIRGLDLEGDAPGPTFLSQAALTRRLAREAREEWPQEESSAARRALVLLGAIPREFDLRSAVIETSASAVGVYDPEADEMFVARARAGATLEPFDLETLAHELDHALVDEEYGIDDESRADRWGDTDSAFAALVEGSATLTELKFIRAYEGPEALQFLLSQPAAALYEPEDLPHYLARAFAFPYVEGIGFVCTLYARGGWKAVDAAFADPPRTSAEILFPERYGTLPRATPPPRLDEPWTPYPEASGVFGAADLLFLFEAPGTNGEALDDPLARARAWNGGAVALWRRGGQSALGFVVAQRDGAPSLCESLLQWYAHAFPDAERGGTEARAVFEGDRQSAVVACRGREVRVGIAPDVATAGELAD